MQPGLHDPLAAVGPLPCSWVGFLLHLKTPRRDLVADDPGALEAYLTCRCVSMGMFMRGNVLVETNRYGAPAISASD